MAIRGRAAGRAGVGLADQVLASLTNFSLTVLVARAVSPAQFGEFSLMMVTAILMAFLARGLASDPLLTRFSTASAEVWRDAVSMSTAVVILFGLGCAVVGCCASLLVPASLRTTVFVFSLALPGVLYQDHVRYAFFAAARPERALFNDGLWFLIQTPILIAGRSAIGGSLAWAIVAWGGSGLFCAVFGGVIQLRLRPAFRRSRHWLSSQYDLWRYYVAENGIATSVNVAILAAVGFITGVSATGALRAATAAFAPVGVVTQGVTSIGVSELARMAAESIKRMRRVVVALSVLLAAATVAYGALMIVVHPLGHILFGRAWTRARPIFPFMVIDAAGTMSSFGGIAGLRALGLGARTLRARIVLTLLRFAAAIAGTWIGGVRGTAIAFAVLGPVQVGYSLVNFLLHARGDRVAPAVLDAAVSAPS